jgi:hypothetical protein
MRQLFLLVAAAALLGGAGCGMFPPTDEAEERRFFGGSELPREILQMDAKPNEPAPADTQRLTPDRTHGGVR